MEFGQGSKEELLPEPREDIVLYYSRWGSTRQRYSIFFHLNFLFARSAALISNWLPCSSKTRGFFSAAAAAVAVAWPLCPSNAFSSSFSPGRGTSNLKMVFRFGMTIKPRSQVSPKITSFCREPAALLPLTDIQREIEIRKR
jgi:hypothetical protein